MTANNCKNGMIYLSGGNEYGNMYNCNAVNDPMNFYPGKFYGACNSCNPAMHHDDMSEMDFQKLYMYEVGNNAVVPANSVKTEGFCDSAGSAAYYMGEGPGNGHLPAYAYDRDQELLNQVMMANSPQVNANTAPKEKFMNLENIDLTTVMIVAGVGVIGYLLYKNRQ